MDRSENAIAVYKSLYMNKDQKSGETVETVDEVHSRVASCISQTPEQAEEFYRILDENIFRPNSPCLINSWKNDADKTKYNNNLVACFVVGLEDNMNSIINLWNTCANVYAGGGGTGFCISNLREAGAPISIGGQASGPIEYMKVVQSISDTVKSGGKARRAANLASFWYQHPDILNFISCKKNHDFSAVNISILVNDEFMSAVEEGKWEQKVELRSPNKSELITTITISDIWQAIIQNAWVSGDPGLLFYDETNRKNPIPSKGEILATNPCLPIWAPVKTTEGYKYLYQVNNNIHIKSLHKSCSDIFKTATDECVYQIEMQSGLCLYLTGNHQVTQPNGIDIEVDKLNIDDPIQMDYTPIEHIHSTTEQEKGFIAGILFADGSLFWDKTKNKIGCSFSLGDKELLYEDEFISPICKHLYDNTLEFKSHHQTDNCKVLRLNKNYHIDLIVNDIFKSESKDNFDLFQHTPSFQLGFIDGMISCDGHILNNSRTKMVNINQSGNIGYRILRQIQLSLSAFGTYSNLTLCNKGKMDPMGRGFYRNPSYSLEITDIKGLSNIITLTHGFKQHEMIKCIDEYGPYKDKQIETLKNSQKIKSITEFSYEDVFDINVPDGEHFVTSGAVVHNCGEVPLFDNSCCDLGSLNLNKFLIKKQGQTNGNMYKLDYDLLETAVKTAVEFLDNIINTTSFPNIEFEETMTSTRPLGLGLMGFADILYKMNIPYGSDESIQLFKRICKCITVTAYCHSIDMAANGKGCMVLGKDESHFRKLLKQYGVPDEYLQKFDNHGIHNSHVTSLAPTGSISISAECCYAFEPMMALIWEKPLTDKDLTLKFINDEFRDRCTIENIELTDELMGKIINNKGSINGIDEFSDKMQSIFVTAHDVGWSKKIDMQAAGQEFISLAISSTCNLPNNATISDVEKAYIKAWKLGLKGITIYRDGSLSDQPVNFGKVDDKLGEEDFDPTFYANPIKLPIKRAGETVKFKSPHGSVYITCNKYKGEIIEIFLNMGKSGQLESLLMKNLSKQISKSLHHRVPIDTILGQMEGEGGHPFWFKLDEEKNINISTESVLDAIAKMIRYHFVGDAVDGYRLDTAGPVGSSLDVCPICRNRTLQRGAGCRGGSCIDPQCGYAACG